MKIKINGTELNAIVDSDIALTKSVNKLQDLANRSGEFSTEIEAGLSSNNRILTKHSQSTDSLTSFPYSVNKCEIEAHGYNVMQGFATLEETSANYKIRAFGELSNIFDLIGDAKLKELNLDYSNGSAINHIWNYTNVISNRNNTWQSGFIYPNINYGKWDSLQTTAYWNDLYPSVFAKYLFLRIFHSIGYSVIGEFLENELFENEILPTVKIPQTPDFVLEGYNTEAITTPNIRYYQQDLFPIVFQKFVKNSSLQLSSGFSGITKFTPIAFGGISMVLSFNASLSVSNTATINLIIEDNGTINIDSYPIVSGTNTFNFTLNKKSSSTRFWISLSQTQSLGYVDISNLSWVNTYNSQILLEGNTVFVNECLPDISQKDFLTTIVNQYNLMITIDSSLRAVNFSYFNSVDPNKSNAIDWTDKLDITDLPTIQYAIDGYGQNNLLSYETDDNDIELRKANTYGQGTLFCNNLNLEKTTEVFKSKFAPIVRVPALRDPITQAFIQLWKSEDGGTTYKTQSVKPRIAYINRGETFTIHGTSGAIGGGSGASNSGPSAGVYFQDLEFAGSLIPKFYNIVVNMLNSPYFLSANFFLKVKDYNEIDFTKPIYLDCIIKGYGNIKGYFYCNEIKQFKINRYETTTVELIKI